VAADALNSARSLGTTVQRLVDEARLGPLHWRVFVLCTLVLMMDGYDLASIGFALPAMARRFGIPAATFGPALSLSFVGVALGSLIAGTLGDRYGRRPAILVSFALVGVASLLMTTADTLVEVAVWRFVTGLGMGGVVPNAVALVSEYMPLRRRAFLVVAAFSSAAFGSFAGSLLAAWLIPHLGWQGVFVVGGLGPLLVTVLVFIWLPESLHFLAASSRGPEAGALARLLAPTWDGVQAPLVVPVRPDTRAPVAELFVGARAAATILIWILFVGTQALVFFMGSWLVTLLTQAGMVIDRALVAVSLFHLGSLAVALFVAWQSDRRSPEKMLAATYSSAAVAVALLAMGGSQTSAVYPLCFVAGGGIVGASFCLGALASSYYPPKIRSMGLGWGLAIGRVGSVTSPLLGGLALGAGWTVGMILAMATVPAVLCMGAVLALRAVTPRVIREEYGR
jgi:AAHS family 4-hydroxybenzoate transporter-like MFS transporter